MVFPASLIYIIPEKFVIKTINKQANKNSLGKTLFPQF